MTVINSTPSTDVQMVYPHLPADYRVQEKETWRGNWGKYDDGF